MTIEKSLNSRIVVIGANGGIGKYAVEQALNCGHAVVAVVRNPEKLGIIHPNLLIKKANVMQAGTLPGIFEREDVVISTIGKNSTKETTLYSQGNKHIIQAMTQAGTTRLLVISASGLDVNPTLNILLRWATKNILQRILKHMYADLTRMERIVKASEMNWTIVRPPRLTNHPRKGAYRIAINDVVRNGQQISRADVADFMLNNIGNVNIFRKTVELAY